VKALTGRELCRLLETRGWVLHRLSGSDHIYKHVERGRVISVPVHAGRTLKAGLQGALLKAAGIEPE